MHLAGSAPDRRYGATVNSGDDDAPTGRSSTGLSPASRRALYRFAFFVVFAGALRLFGAPRSAFIGLVVVAAVFTLVRRSLLKRSSGPGRRGWRRGRR